MFGFAILQAGGTGTHRQATHSHLGDGRGKWAWQGGDRQEALALLGRQHTVTWGMAEVSGRGREVTGRRHWHS